MKSWELHMKITYDTWKLHMEFHMKRNRFHMKLHMKHEIVTWLDIWKHEIMKIRWLHMKITYEITYQPRNAILAAPFYTDFRGPHEGSLSFPGLFYRGFTCPWGTREDTVFTNGLHSFIVIPPRTLRPHISFPLVLIAFYYCLSAIIKHYILQWFYNILQMVTWGSLRSGGGGKEPAAGFNTFLKGLRGQWWALAQYFHRDFKNVWANGGARARGGERRAGAQGCFSMLPLLSHAFPWFHLPQSHSEPEGPLPIPVKRFEVRGGLNTFCERFWKMFCAKCFAPHVFQP